MLSLCYHENEGAMPRKVRELEADLRKAGFTRQPGKGSHRRWVHHLYLGHVAIASQEGDDAKRYQERQVADAIQAVRDAQKRQP
jgi:predicted RNA binding protein YcfA (HicA-like mRNA interferase family)